MNISILNIWIPRPLEERLALSWAAVYAVYDFTVMAIFKDYPLYLALGDTLWGGILFTGVRYLADKFDLV